LGRSAANANAIRSQQNLSNKNQTSTAGVAPTPAGTIPAAPPPVIAQNPGTGYNPSTQPQPGYQTYSHNNNGSSFWSNAFWFMLGRSTASHASPSNNGTGTVAAGGADGSTLSSGAGGTREPTPLWVTLLGLVLTVVFVVVVFKIIRAIWRLLFSRSPAAAGEGNSTHSNYSLK